MSFRTMRWYEFDCDTDGCDVGGEDVLPRRDVNIDRPLRQARAELATTGWTFKNGKDYCPKCSREGRQ